jgi:hypothetical protein
MSETQYHQVVPVPFPAASIPWWLSPSLAEGFGMSDAEQYVSLPETQTGADCDDRRLSVSGPPSITPRRPPGWSQVRDLLALPPVHI